MELTSLRRISSPLSVTLLWSLCLSSRVGNTRGFRCLHVLSRIWLAPTVFSVPSMADAPLEELQGDFAKSQNYKQPLRIFWKTRRSSKMLRNQRAVGEETKATQNHLATHCSAKMTEGGRRMLTRHTVVHPYQSSAKVCLKLDVSLPERIACDVCEWRHLHVLGSRVTIANLVSSGV